MLTGAICPSGRLNETDGGISVTVENIGNMDGAEVATAYFAWSTGKVGEIAEILGFKDEAKYYAALYGKVREAYQKEFLPGDV